MKKLTKVQSNQDLQDLLNRILTRIVGLEKTVAELDAQVEMIVDALADEIPRGELDS